MPAQKPSRRTVLKGAASLTAVAGLAACGNSDTGTAPQGAPAVLSKRRNLRMVTAWPKNFPGLGTGVDRLAARLAAVTDGQITIKVFAAGELVGGLGGFDAVSGGQADMYHAAEYYWQGKSPAFNFFAAVPMGMTATEQTAWLRFGGGQELWDELAAPFGVKPLAAGNTGTQMGGWFANDITSIQDFQGLRIRMPGLGGEVLRRLGAAPVTKAGGEVFQALSQGNIDATEWIGPWNDLAFGFHSIVKNYYYPGIHEPGTTLSLGINKDLWDDMSASERAIIETCAAAENDVMLAEFNTQNSRALDTLVRDHGVLLKRFPEDVLTRMAEISRDVLAEAAQHDDLTRRVFDSFSAARTAGRRWGEIADRAFADARDLIR